MTSKLISCILMLYLFNLYTLAQTEWVWEFYFYTPEQIEFNKENKTHQKYELIEIEQRNSKFTIGTTDDWSDEVIIQAVSYGKVSFKGDRIYCYDKRLNRTYRFIWINDYTIEALNHTAVFVKGTKFYLHKSYNRENHDWYNAYFDTEDLIYSNYWKTGIREGIHYLSKNKQYQLIYYENNIPIDSLVINEKDSNRLQKDVFIEKYHKKLPDERCEK